MNKMDIRLEAAENFINGNRVVWINSIKQFFKFEGDTWILYRADDLVNYVTEFINVKYNEFLDDRSPEKVKMALEIIGKGFINSVVILIRDRVTVTSDVFNGGWDDANILSNEELLEIRREKAEKRKMAAADDNTVDEID